MKDKKDQNKNISISVKNVSKTFSIPHESINTLKGAFVNIFQKNTYEKFNALDDVSFEVKKGEFFGILGRNGSGKSTLLKILAGVYVADKGDIKIEGLVSPFLELGIGFNPELSGRDNIYLNATVLGLTEKEIDEKFDSIVAFSELERFIDQKIKNYSSGMQVRLAFSVAIHANREILLMDEVLAVGDANFQSKCLTEFSRYKEMGKTVILVTHDVSIIQRYCDRAMLLRNGKIFKIGNAEEVGNEYIYQNMSDEEKRIAKELIINNSTIVDIKVKEGRKNEDDKIEEKGNKTRWGNGKVNIKNIIFGSDNNLNKNIFKVGDSIKVRVDYEILENIENPNFGVAIFKKDSNLYCYDISTYLDKIDLNKKDGLNKNGSFEILFKDVNLLEGVYYLKVGIFGDYTRYTFDFFDHGPEFRIVSLAKKEYGTVFLKHEWNLENI